MFRAQPRTELSKFINKLIKVPVAGTPVEVIRQYIETQGEKSIEHSISFRIYPTEEQKILLGKTFGCCRFLYNQMLDDKIREYEKTKKMLKTHRPCIKGNIHF